MVKSEIISAVAEQAGMTKKDATAAVNAVFGVITDAVVRGEKVSVDKFGTFETKVRAERDCRNPQNGDKVHVPSKKTMGFKASKTIKDVLNG